MHAAAILVAGGRGARFRGYKQFEALAGRSILSRSLLALQGARTVASIAIVLPRELTPSDWGRALRDLSPRKVAVICAGGDHRVLSVRAGVRALARVGRLGSVVAVHDAARPLATAELVDATVRAARRHGGAVAAAAATDTVKQVERLPLVARSIARREVFLAQTPQAFRSQLLSDLLERLPHDLGGVTDEATLVEQQGRGRARVAVVAAPRSNLKITEPADLAVAATLLGEPGRDELRVGHGFDLHRLGRGRELWLGGVRIAHDRGLIGHSDGDVLLHALVDAILGALGDSDIGSLFPDTSARFAGARSATFVAEAVRRVRFARYRVDNVDLVLHAERPKVAPHYAEMRASIARLLCIEPSRIGLKARTHEGLGEVGAGHAMAATALVLLRRARRP